MTEFLAVVIALIVGIVAGGVGVWLVLRNNPQIEAKLDDLATKIEQLKK